MTMMQQYTVNTPQRKGNHITMNMLKMVTTGTVLLGLAAAVIAPTHAQAPNATTAPTGAAVLTSSGAILPTVNAAGPIGTWTEAVYNNASLNPFGAGSLTFVFTVTQTSGPDAPGPGFSSFDFGILNTGVASNLSYDATGSTAPSVISATRNGSTATYATLVTGNDGVTTTGSAMSTGQKTGSFVIYTNAKNLTLGTGDANNSGVHMFTGGPIYAATTAPEPTTLAAFGFVAMGLTGLALRARRSKVNLPA